MNIVARAALLTGAWLFLSSSWRVAAQTPANSYLVEWRGAQPSNLSALVAAAGGALVRVHPEIKLATATSDNPSFGANLRSSGAVSAIIRDLMVQWTPQASGFTTAAATASAGHGGSPASAFFFPCQWNLNQIDAPGAWAKDQFGAPGVKVAVLDSGVDPSHFDLMGRIDVANSKSFLSSPSFCDLFAPDQSAILDFGFHGTFVSALITANGVGVAGVTSRSQIVGVKVQNCLGQGTFADLIAGILYAAQLPDVHVINMSISARFPKNLPGAGALVAALNQTVNFANSRGKLVVSSAGNDAADLNHDKNFIVVPAQSGAGIAAWAVDIDGGLASYSNYGVSGTWVGAGGGDMTPGSPKLPLPGCLLPSFHDRIVSACSSSSLFFPCGSGFTYLFGAAGTSFSAALVSGVAALVDGKFGGALNAGQLKSRLAQTADDLGRKGVDPVFSHGRVNAAKAVY